MTLSKIAPICERVDDTAIAQGDQAASRASTRPNRMLFIDATGVLLSFGSAPTGIPRLEEFLVRAALEDPDPAVMLVKLSRNRRSYQSLNAFEQQQLRDGLANDQLDFRGHGLAGRLRQTFRVIRRNPTIGRDADRHFADIATNSRRRGFSYQAIKTLIRGYRLYRRCVAQFAIARSGSKSGPVDLSRGTLLLSNRAVLSVPSKTFDAAQDRAFISYDLIPITHPPFAIDADFARRFATNISRVMQLHHTTALCISETSKAMLSEYARSAGFGTARVGHFPLPSILREKAARLPHAPESRPGEPFVVYCSTIEARKNHLLLARVWQRAHEGGVALPKLVCAGKWGWGVDELKSYLAAHPDLSSRIVFTGPVSDAELIGYYRGAIFGVVPSYVEGWGYGASECLDFGIPVIVSTAPALREATRGLMPAIAPDDLAGWYGEIRSLSESGERRAWYRRQIADHYRPTSTAASWAHIKAALRHD